VSCGRSDLTSKLNDVQMKVVDYVLRQHGCGKCIPPLAVFGAFGTGKTETLALAALSLVSQSKTTAKILIATHTNRYLCCIMSTVHISDC